MQRSTALHRSWTRRAIIGGGAAAIGLSGQARAEFISWLFDSSLFSAKSHLDSVSCVAFRSQAEAATPVAFSIARDRRAYLWLNQDDEFLAFELPLPRNDAPLSRAALSSDWSRLLAVRGGPVEFVEVAASPLSPSILRRLAILDSGDYPNAVIFRSDNAFALIGGRDRVVRIWDLATFEQVRELTPLGGAVLHIALSPDDAMIAASSADGAITVWDWESGDIVQRVSGGNGPAPCIAFALGGRSVLSGHYGELRLWDVGTGTARVLPAHERKVHALAVTPDGTRAISGGWDRQLLVWDLVEGLPIGAKWGHAAPIESLALSPNGTRAITGDVDGVVKIWSI